VVCLLHPSTSKSHTTLKYIASHSYTNNIYVLTPTQTTFTCTFIPADASSCDFHAYLLLSCEGQKTMVLETGEELNEVTDK
jgi:hypothetical protein